MARTIGRPRVYEMGTRVHLGTKFDRHLAAMFEQLAKRHHLTRTQALENLVSHAVKSNSIPPFAEEVNRMIEDRQALLMGSVVKEQAAPQAEARPVADFQQHRSERKQRRVSRTPLQAGPA